MEFLTKIARDELYQFIIKSHCFGLIGFNETSLRFEALSAMSEYDKTSSNVDYRSWPAENLELDVSRCDSECKTENINRPEKVNKNRNTNGGLESFDDNHEDDFLSFKPDATTKLTKWIFHKTDDDFFPSIPHGHWEGRASPKLDPYTGWCYNGSSKKNREKRDNIIALWNDQKFRNFAREAIDYYITHFPGYSGWRVSNPRKLPKRR